MISFNTYDAKISFNTYDAMIRHHWCPVWVGMASDVVKMRRALENGENERAVENGESEIAVYMLRGCIKTMFIVAMEIPNKSNWFITKLSCLDDIDRSALKSRILPELKTETHDGHTCLLSGCKLIQLYSRGYTGHFHSLHISFNLSNCLKLK